MTSPKTLNMDWKARTSPWFPYVMVELAEVKIIAESRTFSGSLKKWCLAEVNGDEREGMGSEVFSLTQAFEVLDLCSDLCT